MHVNLGTIIYGGKFCLLATKSPFLPSTVERETEVMDDIVIKQLTPMFPQLTPDVIRLSVQHVSNRGEPLGEGYLLQRCIDDLLELRTYRLETSFEGPQDGRSQVAGHILASTQH